MQNEIEELRIKLEDQNTELEWLRYFYDAASGPFGPADSDIYQMIKDDFVAGGGVLPEAYQPEVEDEEFEDEE